MTQTERRAYLIRELLNEQPEYAGMEIPQDEGEQKRLLRGLFNIRMPKPVSKEFLEIQDNYLQTATSQKGVTDVRNLTPAADGLYLWRGDITTLKVDAIVNAANSQMLGCFCPNHGCIDNAIHTYAGVQLRLECAKIMKAQGTPEPTGTAKITGGYNLPAKYVLHTVGPIVGNRVTKQDEELLASCYRSCLELASAYHLQSIAFCCISTGEFHFPNKLAAKIALHTVTEYRANHSDIEVIFNVFGETDERIYRELLEESRTAES